MLRSVSREGQREATNNPQLSKKRRPGRVQSARLSEDKLVKGMYRDISKFVIYLPSISHGNVNACCFLQTVIVWS